MTDGAAYAVVDPALLRRNAGGIRDPRHCPALRQQQRIGAELTTIVHLNILIHSWHKGAEEVERSAGNNVALRPRRKRTHKP